MKVYRIGTIVSVETIALVVRELEKNNIPEFRGIFGRIQGTSTGA